MNTNKINFIRFHIITVLPQCFPGLLGHSLLGRGLKENKWALNIVDLRTFGNKVDDRPYGGGPGLVLRPDVLGQAIDSVLLAYSLDKIIYMSARGKPLTQELSVSISQSLSEVMIICGRFEGVDQRIIEFYNIEEISIGDYVISGGDLAAMVLIDSCIRLIPGIIGNPESLQEESFNAPEEVEYSHYTRPEVWKNLKVPEVLASGHHQQIKEWRHADAMHIKSKLKRIK